MTREEREARRRELIERRRERIRQRMELKKHDSNNTNNNAKERQMK